MTITLRKSLRSSNTKVKKGNQIVILSSVTNSRFLDESQIQSVFNASRSEEESLQDENSESSSNDAINFFLDNQSAEDDEVSLNIRSVDLNPPSVTERVDFVKHLEENFKFTNLGKFLRKSINEDKNILINLMSHETFKVNQERSGDVDSNIQFLSKDSIANEDFLSLKENEIDKYESLTERLLVSLDYNLHHDALKENYENTLQTVDLVNDITLIDNKLKNEINYGNIVEKFIINGVSRYNGKISNEVLKYTPGYYLSALTSSSNRILLDKQDKPVRSVISSDLPLFYETVNSFKLSETNESFLNSLVNFKIINSDRLVGQLMVNYAVSQNSLYPNSDVARKSLIPSWPRSISISEEALRDASFNRINSTALNRFPIIKVKDLNSESRIFGDSNLEILSFNGKKLNTYDIKLNYRLDAENRAIRNFSGDYSPIKTLRESVRNSEDRFISERTSLAGKKSFFNNRPIRDFNNNIFNILYKPTDSLRGQVTSDFLYETIFIDSTTNSTIASGNKYLSNSYLVLPNRFFGEDEIEIEEEIPRVDSRTNQLNLSETIRTFNSTENTTEKFVRSINNFERVSNNTRKIFRDTLVKNYIAPRYKKIYDEYKQSIFANRSGHAYNAVLDLQGNYIEGANNLDSLLTEYRSVAPDEQDSVEVEGLIISEVDQRIFNSLDDRERFKFGFNFKRKDCFVYKTSNSFLTNRDLNLITKSYFKDLKTINRNTLSKENFSYIKSNEEKLVNKNRLDESLDILLSEAKGNDRIDNICLSIASAVNIAKKSLSKNSDVFDNLLKSVKSKLSSSESFTLLYGDKNETCLDIFSESKFIKFNEGISFYKNNFVERFDDNVLNSMDIILNEEEDLENNHIFTSSEYRSYLSKIYTNSFLRDKTSLLARIVSDNIDIYKTNSNYEREAFLGFDVLLATALLNEDKNNTNSIKDICKLVLANAVARISEFKKSVSGLLEKPTHRNKVGEKASNNSGFKFNKDIRNLFGDVKIDSIVNNLYSQKNVKRVLDLENRILRSTNLDLTSNAIDRLNLSSLNNTSGIDFKIVDGHLVEFLFPMVNYISVFENDSLNVSSRIKNFDSRQDASELEEKNILSAVSNSFYNYDIFTSADSTGILYFEDESDESGESFKILKGFTYDTESKNLGTDLRIDYFRYKKVDLNDNSASFESINDLKIPYVSTFFDIPFSYFYLAENQNTFSGKLTSIAVDLLKIFEENFDSFNTFDDVLNFVDSKESYIEILSNIYEIHSLLFLQSYTNYKEIIVENSRDKLVEEDNIGTISGYVISQNQFASGVLENKRLAVSDLKALLESIENLMINPSYVKEDSIFEESDDILFGSRAKVMQSVASMLRNSDISDAICHDIIHGYFANFEDNISAEQEDALTLNSSIDSLNQKIRSVEGLSDFNIKSRILNEFYQNILSKNLQETLYYKNLQNEIFVKNNLFNSVKEKYESLNIYNQLKVYNDAMYRRGVDALKLISRISTSTENIDILKIPISYDLVNKIGSKGIIQVSILPVNLKFPEIEYEQLNFFYTPLLTEVTSNFYSDISSNFYDYIGMYNSAQKTSERYNVVSEDIAISEIRRIMEEVFIRRAELSGEDIEFDIDLPSEKTVFDAKISSAIKAIDFIGQGHLNSNLKEEDFTFENLVSGKAIQLVNSVSLDNLSKIFENFKNDLTGLEGDTIFDIETNTEIYETKEFYKKFLNRLSKDMSEIDIIEDILPTINYDVFGFAINKNILRIVDSDEELIARRIFNLNNNGVLSPNDNKSFNYYVEIKVL